MANQTHQGVDDLWQQASMRLQPQDKRFIDTLEAKSPSLITDVLAEAHTKRDMAAAKHWRFTKSNGDTIILRDIFEKILGSISRFAQVGDIIANVDPLHAGLPWAAIRLMLQVSVSDLNAFGTLSEGLDLIAGLIVRYRVLENVCAHPAKEVSSEQQYLSSCIIRVYTAVLTYLACAIKHWAPRTITRVAKNLFRDMDSEYRTLQLAVSKADDEAFRTAEIIRASQLSRVSEEILETLTKLVDEMQTPFFRLARQISQVQDRLDQGQRKEVFYWLSTIPCEMHHITSCKKILEGTGRWLLRSSTFLSWINSSTSALCWLSGIPGCGKSKLTSIVIQSFLDQNIDANADRPPVAYFYCSQKSTDPRTADPREIMCAILRQLVGRDACASLRGDIGQEYQRRKELADQKGSQIMPLEFEDVVARILSIAKDEPLTIILDALDEIEESGRGELFDALERIVQESLNIVKIFVSSRDDGDIVDRFERCPKIRVDDMLNGNDIRDFIGFKVNEAIVSKKVLRGKVSKSLRDDIASVLAQKAHGMFRWVELSIEMLCDSRRLSVEKDVRSLLGRLPATLKQQYAAICQRINDSAPSTAAIARRAFSWILAAQRSLTIEEFIAAVALDADGYYHQDLDEPRLLDVCQNLLVVVSTDDKTSSRSFQVAHLSVKDYLTDVPEFFPEVIHSLAVSRCLQVFDPHALVGDQQSSYGGSGEDLLLPYAIYLFEHASMSDLTRPSSAISVPMKSFLFDKMYKLTPASLAWVQLAEGFFGDMVLPHDNKDLPLYTKMQDIVLAANGFYFACRYGLLAVLKTLEGDAEVPWASYPHKYQPSHLCVAVEDGRFAIAKWLLENDINEADESRLRVTPLYSAVRDGDSAMVKLLLDHGADPLHDRSEKCFLHTPWWTSLRGVKNLEVFRRLLGNIEALSKTQSLTIATMGYDWKAEALIDALLNSWSDAVEMLIERGANVHARTCRTDEFMMEPFRHSTTLQIAVQYCEIGVVELLLNTASVSGSEFHEKTYKDTHDVSDSMRSFVNALDDFNRSAIHYLRERESTVAQESQSVMTMLFKYGADHEIICCDGITSLHVAAAIGFTALVQRLISKGMDIRSRCNRGGTLLHYAATGSHPQVPIIQYLVEAGLDASEKDTQGKSPLFYAAASCNSVALEALIGVASTSSCQKIVDSGLLGPKFSLSADGTVSSDRQQMVLGDRDKEGNTLLHVIATGDNMSFWGEGEQRRKAKDAQVETVVNLLLDLGADNKQRNNQGRTPLSILTRFSSSSNSGAIAVKMLLARGADPNLPDSEGMTAMHYAAENTWTESLEALTKAGANIEARDNKLRTPLHVAASEVYQPQVARFLLLHGADHTAKDIRGATALHLAAQNFLEIFNMLIKANADVNAVDADGLTPLHWGAKAGNPYTVQVSLDAGAVPDALGHCGLTPMQMTAEHALIYTEEQAEETWFSHEYLGTWYKLYCVTNRVQDEDSLPVPRLKRSQSMKLRIEQSWGDFRRVREEIARPRMERDIGLLW